MYTPPRIRACICARTKRGICESYRGGSARKLRLFVSPQTVSSFALPLPPHSLTLTLSFARSRTQSLPICLPFLPFSFPTPLYMILSHFLNLRHAISFAISLSRMKSMKVHLVSLISSHSIISCTIRHFQSCIFLLNALVRSKNLRICSQTYENLRRKT